MVKRVYAALLCVWMVGLLAGCAGSGPPAFTPAVPETVPPTTAATTAPPRTYPTAAPPPDGPCFSAVVDSITLTVYPVDRGGRLGLLLVPWCEIGAPVWTGLDESAYDEGLCIPWLEDARGRRIDWDYEAEMEGGSGYAWPFDVPYAEAGNYAVHLYGMVAARYLTGDGEYGPENLPLELPIHEGNSLFWDSLEVNDDIATLRYHFIKGFWDCRMDTNYYSDPATTFAPVDAMPCEPTDGYKGILSWPVEPGEPLRLRAPGVTEWFLRDFVVPLK